MSPPLGLTPPAHAAVVDGRAVGEPKPGPRRDDALKTAARSFEAVFLRQMIASMRAPSLGEDLFGSDASNQFRDMSDARLADAMAGKFGIAALIEKQLKGAPE